MGRQYQRVIFGLRLVICLWGLILSRSASGRRVKCALDDNVDRRTLCHCGEVKRPPWSDEEVIPAPSPVEGSIKFHTERQNQVHIEWTQKGDYVSGGFVHNASFYLSLNTDFLSHYRYNCDVETNKLNKKFSKYPNLTFYFEDCCDATIEGRGWDDGENLTAVIYSRPMYNVDDEAIPLVISQRFEAPTTSSRPREKKPRRNEKEKRERRQIRKLEKDLKWCLKKHCPELIETLVTPRLEKPEVPRTQKERAEREERERRQKRTMRKALNHCRKKKNCPKEIETSLDHRYKHSEDKDETNKSSAVSLLIGISVLTTLLMCVILFGTIMYCKYANSKDVQQTEPQPRSILVIGDTDENTIPFINEFVEVLKKYGRDQINVTTNIRKISEISNVGIVEWANDNIARPDVVIFIVTEVTKIRTRQEQARNSVTEDKVCNHVSVALGAAENWTVNGDFRTARKKFIILDLHSAIDRAKFPFCSTYTFEKGFKKLLKHAVGVHYDKTILSNDDVAMLQEISSKAKNQPENQTSDPGEESNNNIQPLNLNNLNVSGNFGGARRKDKSYRNMERNNLDRSVLYQNGHGPASLPLLRPNMQHDPLPSVENNGVGQLNNLDTSAVAHLYRDAAGPASVPLSQPNVRHNQFPSVENNEGIPQQNNIDQSVLYRDGSGLAIVPLLTPNVQQDQYPSVENNEGC